MPAFFIKITKLGLWVLIATLFLSGARFEKYPLSGSLSYFDYHLQVSGSLNQRFHGNIEFETAIETTNKGISVSTLKIVLIDKEGVLPHNIEFLIARENMTTVLSEESYSIGRNKEGLLNYFDGVFGVANIKALGELPLFAKSGRIQIDFLDEMSVQGSLNVKLINSDGQSIHLKGNFAARK